MMELLIIAVIFLIFLMLLHVSLVMITNHILLKNNIFYKIIDVLEDSANNFNTTYAVKFTDVENDIITMYVENGDRIDLGNIKNILKDKNDIKLHIKPMSEKEIGLPLIIGNYDVMICEKCGGYGKFSDEDHDCTVCGGYGLIKTK